MPALALVERKSLVESTIDAMRAHISQRHWRVGDRIPPEADLAASLGVGRNTIREAIRVLSNSQMLEVRQGDGTYVRSEIDAVQTVRKLATVGLIDHLELQQMLETEAARFAAVRATVEDVAKLRKLLNLRGDYLHHADRSQAELDEFLDRDGEFHKAVAGASHNAALQTLYQHFTASVRQYTREIVEQGGLPEPDLATHAAIVDAIAARDAERAAFAAHSMLLPLIKRLRDAAASAR